MGKIIFWDINNRNMGGIEKIILTMTVEFSKNKEVIVISKPNSTVLNILNASEARFKWLQPEKSELNEHIKKNDLLIIFYPFKEIKLLKQVNPYVLIWNVFPPFGKISIAKRITSYIQLKELSGKNSMVTMDPHCREIFQKRYGINLSKKYLKIPIEIRPNSFKYKTANNLINITYIGRGNEIWKIKPVSKLIKDLATVQSSNFLINIFTDTSELFEKEISKVIAPNIKTTFHLGYWGEKLSAKLTEVSDIHYSMGTSMLEGAALGIPAIIADARLEDFPDSYKYRWFIDDVEHYAGCFIDDNDQFPGHSVHDIINQAHDKEMMEMISRRQYEYIVKTFSPSIISENIEKLNPKASVKTITKYSPKLWF